MGEWFDVTGKLLEEGSTRRKLTRNSTGEFPFKWHQIPVIEWPQLSPNFHVAITEDARNIYDAHKTVISPFCLRKLRRYSFSVSMGNFP
jgi:hypothetical protein